MPTPTSYPPRPPPQRLVSPAEEHLQHLQSTVALLKAAEAESAEESERLAGAMAATIAEGVPELPEPEPELLPPLPPVPMNPASLTGLWRAWGSVQSGGQTEEFLQLDVRVSGRVSGMVDSDGDGVWSEDDCRIASGLFNGASNIVRFVQIYAAKELLDVRWTARYDKATDTFTDGSWMTDDGPGGVFSMERTTEEQMLNREGADAAREMKSPGGAGAG